MSDSDDSDNYIDVDDLTTVFGKLQIHYEEPLLIKQNPDILSDMLKVLDVKKRYSGWHTTEFDDKVFKLIELEEDTFEYYKIKAFFNTTMRKCYTVNKIDRVENPYLFIQYSLMRMKKNCSHMTLFHGTTRQSIEPICRENFNWRLAGTSFGHKFGKGISFSPDSTYSSYYPKNYFESQRIMFVANVLIKSSCYGSPSMTIPIGSADTSIKSDGKVVVKYEDNDFYPQYIIYYS